LWCILEIASLKCAGKWCREASGVDDDDDGDDIRPSDVE
jgi:hypothetical protein